MVSKERLLKDVPLSEFFMERVQEALVHQRIKISHEVEFYLVNLLQEFKKTEKLFEKQGTKMTEKPLALILAKAVEADTATKIRCLKQIGDMSLYTAGFFSGSIRKKPVSSDYYIRMGGGAYYHLSGLLNRQKTFAQLYRELSQFFPDLVGILTEVALSHPWHSNEEILQIYERWLETGNRHLESLLQKEGIVTQDAGSFQKPQ